MTASGALTFARYAFPPNDLGYCGPDDARAMLVPGAVEEIGRRARRFEGAWVYLEVLAEAAGSEDLLAEEVVEAYWVGNDLLDAVDPAHLGARLRERFRGQRGGTWQDAGARARAHHSFQVLEVYPWASTLRAGLPPGPAIDVLDRCRIRTGEVTEVDGELVAVTSRVLAWDGVDLAPAAAAPERARWSVDGLSLIDVPVVGDLVALHWDWVCDILTHEQADRLEELELDQLRNLGLAHPSVR